MAVGEGACVSVHGANRLCPNSLDLVVLEGRTNRAIEVLKKKPENHKNIRIYN